MKISSKDVKKINLFSSLPDNLCEKISNVISSTRLDCLDIIASTNDLVGAEVELVNLMARERQLEKALKSVQKNMIIF